MASIEELLQTASAAAAPRVVAASEVQVGGVDPLGLRQINFDLMDKVLPGLNNVAEKLRPFVLMTWAWRRVRVIMERDKLGGATDDELRDFVDRIEAIYAWSQFLIDPNAGIPGGQALAELILGEANAYRFGGSEWEKRRDLRRSSTGLISPLNYGPGLRSMGWLIPAGPAGVFQPNPTLDSMLDSFEACFEGELSHPAFNKFGSLEVNREDVRRWGTQWALSDLTEAERQAGYGRLVGPDADMFRQEGIALLEEAIDTRGDTDRNVGALRRSLADPADSWLINPDLRQRANAWRRLQIRQLFRLSLEGLFYWILGELSGPPLSSAEIARRFAEAAAIPGDELVKVWLSDVRGGNPVEHLDALEAVLQIRDRASLPPKIVAGLHYCLTDGALENWDKAEVFDRLPLSRALFEIEQWHALTVQQLIENVIETWVIAQHAYWCVGRGLADARGHGKTLLRLRIVMDEGGWTLTPGASVGGAPVPTPDRLQTAVSLLRECGRI